MRDKKMPMSKIRGAAHLRVPIEKMIWKRKKAIGRADKTMNTIALKQTIQEKMSLKKSTGEKIARNS
jgi:hypothetical protein